MTKKACKGVVTALGLGWLGLKRNAFGRLYVVAESVSWAYGCLHIYVYMYMIAVKYIAVR